MRQVVSTPAGPLALTCAVDGLEPDLVHTHVSTTSVVEQWSVPHHLDVSVVRASIDPPFGQEHGQVDGYVAVVWTLHAHQACGPITVGAHFTDVAAFGAFTLRCVAKSVCSPADCARPSTGTNPLTTPGSDHRSRHGRCEKVSLTRCPSWVGPVLTS